MERQKFLDAIAESEGKEKYGKILDYSLYLRQVDADESARQAKIVYDHARHQNEYELEITSIIYICNAYFYNSNYDQINFWTDILYKIGVKHKDNKAIGDSYNMKARIAFYQDNINLAQEHLVKALEYLVKTDSLLDLLSCYNGLGLIHLANNELDEAHYYLSLALEVAEQKGSEAQHSIRLNISNILFSQEKYREALEVNQRVLKFYQDNDRFSMMASALKNIAQCYGRLDNIDKAVEYFNRSRDLYIKTNQPLELCKCINSMVTLFINYEDWENAEKSLDEAREIAEQNNYKSNLTEIYDNYANVLETKGDYKTANKYLHQLLTINKELSQEKHQEKLTELETQYKTEIYKLKTAELDKKNKAMNNQIEELNASLSNLQNTYLSLQKDFEQTVKRLNDQDNLLSSQSRMSLMGGMISAIAHQWKQPLNVIWVLVQAIDDSWRFNELNEEFMDNQVKQIGDQIKYMSDTVNDFSKFFKPEYEKEYKVDETIKKSLKLITYMLKTSNIDLITDLEPGCHLSGNPNELSQVIINIINNAREAIKRGNITDPEIRIKLEYNTDNLTIRIFNTGDQIDPDKLDKIFEPYYTTRGEEGTGLGLQICRQIIENKYKGNIIAKNCEGGVEFVIKIGHEADLN